MKTQDEIQVLEHITKTCKTLKDIVFRFTDPSNEYSSSLLTDNAILDMEPNCNIESINGTIRMSRFHRVFSYIILKFPRLQQSVLTISLGDTILVDYRTIILLYQHLSKLSKCSVEYLRFDQQTIWDAIGNHWNGASKLGGEDLELRYDNTYLKSQLSISKDENSTKTSFVINHFNLLHISFLENYGKYIGSLEFSFVTNDHSCRDLPDNFMTHISTHCPHLKSLTIEGCAFRRLSYFEIDLRRKLSLSKLTFHKCLIYAGVLEQLSFFVSKIELFHMGYDLQYRHNVEDISATPDLLVDRIPEIVMPHTTINQLTLRFVKYTYDNSIFIKLYPSTEQNYYFYRIDHEDRNCCYKDIKKEVSEEEFLRTTEGNRIYICCQNISKFAFAD